MSKKAVIVVNPVAGKRQMKRDLLDLVALVEKQDYETILHITKSRGDASLIAEQYSSLCDLMVCCGGDGTLNEVISGLLKSEIRPPLLYYPCGSTNDFAATLGLPKSVNASSFDIASRKVLNLDVGVLNGERYFSYITSYGIFTKASFSAQQKVKNAIGHLAYILEGAKEIPQLGKAYPTRVTYEGGTIKGNFAMVAVTNSTSAGGVLRLPSDKVRLDDGLFELLLVRGLTDPVTTAAVVKQLVSQKYDGKNIILLQTKKVKIECEEAPSYCTDGEYAGDIRCAEVECLPGAIRLLV